MPRTLDWHHLLPDGRAGAAPEPASAARSPFQRDHDRILFSGPFRRLADKTQVFPLPVDDHVHSRLTHSLEVASIGRSLGTLVGRRLVEAHGALPNDRDPRDVGDCVAAACLAHDLGNPPFGHVGEEAIQEYFARAGTRAFDGSTVRTATGGPRPLRGQRAGVSHPDAARAPVAGVMGWSSRTPASVRS